MAEQSKRGRPHMQNYGIAESEAGLMSWEWVDEQLTKSRNYWIASTRPDGKPHAAPVWGVWLNGVLYFSSDEGSRKARNLAANPEVVVHLESGDDCVILEGRVEVMGSRDELLALGVGKAYSGKYPPFDPFENGEMFGRWYRLRPRTALAWLEKDFPNTATRWDFTG
jgi:hypothetical protein